jgi:hypothetical protein
VELTAERGQTYCKMPRLLPFRLAFTNEKH